MAFRIAQLSLTSPVCRRALCASSARLMGSIHPLNTVLNVHAPVSVVSGRSLTTTRAEGEATGAAGAAAAVAEDFSGKMDIRVGKILSVEKHPDADSLFVEQIDLGEAEGPRTIVSGLVKYVSAEELKDRKVLVVANLKPRNMRGVKSNGMLLCASDAPHEKVEPLTVPEATPVGERVWFGETNEQGEAANPNQVQKKKMWEEVQPLLKTSSDRVANYKGRTMMTSGGAITAPTLADGNIS